MLTVLFMLPSAVFSREFVPSNRLFGTTTRTISGQNGKLASQAANNLTGLFQHCHH